MIIINIIINPLSLVRTFCVHHTMAKETIDSVVMVKEMIQMSIITRKEWYRKCLSWWRMKWHNCHVGKKKGANAKGNKGTRWGRGGGGWRAKPPTHLLLSTGTWHVRIYIYIYKHFWPYYSAVGKRESDCGRECSIQKESLATKGS